MLELEPLPEPHAQEFVALLGTDRLSEHAQVRIVETGDGNPLFLEQLVAVQASGEPATLPPSVQAVLAARIDRLEPGERAVLARASVEGRSFHRGAVASLLPEGEERAIATHLMALVRKQLVRADRPSACNPLLPALHQARPEAGTLPHVPHGRAAAALHASPESG